MVGQNIGKYRVVDRIGRGGMGTVYRAVDETLHRDVAIKVLNAELSDPEIARRFRAEAITVARLNHPGIATIFELFQHEGQWLMVMEFVRGETLERLVDRAGPLAPERTADLCMQVLAALAHAHSMGVVHRDLKPANIMLTEAGGIKVMDFGIARVAGTEHLTNAGFMMGTPAYMAPEQVMGKEIDARADLYAIGMVFYRLTAGKLPFKSDTPFGMAQAQVNDAPMPIGEVRAGLPPWVEQIIARALAKGPDQRFQSAVEFYEALARCVEGLPVPAPYSSSAPTEMIRTPARAMPTGAVGRTTPPSMPPLTGRPADLTPVTQPVPSTAPGLDPTVLSPKPGGGPPAVPASTDAAAQVTVPVPAAGSAAGDAGDVKIVSGAMPTPPQGTSPEPIAPRKVAVEKRVKAAGKTPSAPGSGVPKLAAAAVAVVLLGGAAVWFATRGPSAPPQTSEAPVPEAPVSAAQGAAAEPAPAPAPAESTPAESATPPLSAAATTADGSASQAPAKPAGRAARGATAASPASRGPVAEETLISIPDVKLYVVTERNKTSDRDVTLNFSNGTMTAVDRDGRVLASIPYSAAVRATYVKARDPKWDPSVPGPPEDVDVGGMLRTSKHWIVLQGVDRYVILRLEDSNWRRAYDAIRTRTGLTFILPANSDKS